ncbi:ATP-binding cassette domain-containing protein [Candidatus Xianfuyuplasma coldseepsis]|uniref:ATP-binding cassette domain-containing protein n=1 Tax=Candidatus Xianfuyuplasma coldseepsis TaxID=2782163 RepID=A0A7L7KTP4_9MOLU|nr:ATP-binding cassette domain-containing protein [Xianfuyuplasma coldseepsis]
MLTIKNLHKSYKHGTNTTHVLKGINLDIEEGSFVSILGRSGSGKTTLLNVLSTLLEFDKGSIHIDGQNISKLGTRKINVIRNNYIGFVFQEFNLVKDMSVLDNVATPMILNGVRFKEARERALVALQQVGLEQYAKVRPVELSGGQQQRVAIARAIVNDQKIILCDEPTGALDDYTAVEILKLLKQLSETRTVIMVTHDEEFAKKYSNRIIMLVDGNIVKDDILEDIPVKAPSQKRKLSDHRAGFLNLFTYSFVSMDIDKKKFGNTFRTFSISLTLFIVVSIINQNLDVFTKRYLDFFVQSEVADRNIILDFIYQFLEQNITQLIQVILYILIGFCIVSYLFVFTINIITKKREIAVLKAFGASQEEIGILFMLRPIKFTMAIFKDTLLYTFILMLLLNGVFDFQAILYVEYYDFVVNIVQVIYGTLLSFTINIDSPLIDFHIHYLHVLPIFFIVLVLFMIGSLIPAYKISRSNTIRMLATE